MNDELYYKEQIEKYINNHKKLWTMQEKEIDNKIILESIKTIRKEAIQSRDKLYLDEILPDVLEKVYERTLTPVEAHIKIKEKLENESNK